jgi:hypothetical protein
MDIARRVEESTEEGLQQRVGHCEDHVGELHRLRWAGYRVVEDGLEEPYDGSPRSGVVCVRAESGIRLGAEGRLHGSAERPH